MISSHGRIRPSRRTSCSTWAPYWRTGREAAKEALRALGALMPLTPWRTAVVLSGAFPAVTADMLEHGLRAEPRMDRAAPEAHRGAYVDHAAIAAAAVTVRWSIDRRLGALRRAGPSVP
ncbi:beta family protein [Streptomyces sp. NBC_01343]|uniref:hypothetical protein n=1 Tax=Streptomyces sp. NBC_01343 TaxID=2903832 RepID=UPI002E156FEC|nr:beta family protein [Streptomyces sp. NBC_01343]